jgi:hypothetical protein
MDEQEQYVTVYAKPFPKLKELKGSYLHKISPLDRFFWMGLGHYIPQTLPLVINPKKVYINPVDAALLYALHRDFMLIIHGPEAKSMAADQWTDLGPNTLKHVPRGVIWLEEGYLTIDDCK